MKKYLLLIIVAIATISCKDKMSDCIKYGMEEDGLSYDEAKENCEDAQMDSQIRD